MKLIFDADKKQSCLQADSISIQQQVDNISRKKLVIKLRFFAY